MKGDHIAYRCGYDYQLVESYQVTIPVHPVQDVITEYVLLNRDGFLSIMRGYAWNGADQAPDLHSIMRGSLVHDALYQLFRVGALDEAIWRESADRLLKQMCTEDGMAQPFAELVYQAVRIFGQPAVDPARAMPVMTAP